MIDRNFRCALPVVVGKSAIAAVVVSFLSSTAMAQVITADAGARTQAAQAVRVSSQQQYADAGSTSRSDNTPTPVSDSASSSDGEIIVRGSRETTGSRLQSGPLATGSVPVTSIDETQIARSGATNLQQVILQLPAAVGAVSVDGQDSRGIATINLRGIGDKYTLLLVNGHRITPELAGNLNLIAPNAVERVDVLKTGASAIYGSDALAGVVNVVTHKGGDGLSGGYQYGHVGDGGLSTKSASISFGATTPTSRVFLAINYYQRTPLAGKDRGAGSNDARPFGGYDGRSGVTVPGSFVYNGTRYILNTNVVARGGYSNNLADYRVFNFERDAFDRLAYGQEVIGSADRLSGYASVEQDIAGIGTAYADVLYKDELLTKGFGSNVITLPNVPGTNPYNPTGQNLTNVSFRLLEFGIARENNQFREYRFLGGLRGGLGGDWKYDVSVEHYGSRRQYNQIGASGFSLPGLIAAVNRSGADALNPFCYLCNTPAQLQGVKIDNAYTIFTRNTAATASLTGSLFSLPAGKVKIAVGAEYRELSLSQVNSEGEKSGQNILGTRSVDVSFSRKVKSIFGESVIPILAGGLINDYRLQLSLAARYEEFSDAGKSFVPAVSTAFEVLPGNLILRASYNKAFNAPALSDLNGTETATVDAFLDPRTNTSVLMKIVSGGNSQLKPEKSDNLSFGFIYQPVKVPGLHIALDYFDVRQKNVIFSPDYSAILSGKVVPGRPFVEGPNVGGPGVNLLVYTNLFNIGSRRFSGLDLDAGYDFSIGNVRLSTQVAGSYILKLDVDATGTGAKSIKGQYSDITFGGNPTLKFRLAQNIEVGAYSANVAFSHTSPLLDQDVANGLPQGSASIAAYDTVDLSAGIDVGKLLFDGSRHIKGLKLRAGVNNLFDKKAPFVKLINVADPAGTYDLRQRFFFMSINADF